MKLDLRRLYYRTGNLAEFLMKFAIMVDPEVAAAFGMLELVAGVRKQPEPSRPLLSVAMTLAKMEKAVTALRAAVQVLSPTSEVPPPFRWRSVPNGQQVQVEFQNTDGTIKLSSSDEVAVFYLLRHSNSQPFLRFEARIHGGRLIYWPRVEIEELISAFEHRSGTGCSGLLNTFSLFWRDIAHALDPSKFNYPGADKSLVRAILAFGCQEAWGMECAKGSRSGRRLSRNSPIIWEQPFRESKEELEVLAKRELADYRRTHSPVPS